MKHFVFFLFLVSCFLFPFVPRANALEPVIINKSEKNYPPDFDHDQDYVPSDPLSVPNTLYSRTFTITNTFTPESTGTSRTDGSTIYTYRDIDKVTQDVNLSTFTNHGFNNIFNHLTSGIKNILAQKDERARAQKNYDLNHPLGTGNFTSRGMPYRDWLCLLSRKIDAVADFNDGNNSTVIDEQVAPGVRFGRAILALQNLPLPIRQKAFLDSQNGYFYYPDCKPATSPTSLPSKVVSALSKSAGPAPSDPLALLQNNAINPMYQGSIASKVQQCDLHDSGAEDCKPAENLSMPRGAGAVAAAGVMNHVKPANSQKERDFGQTVNNSPIPDRPNPVSWLAAFFKAFFSGELTETKTFSGPTKINYWLVNDVKKGLEEDQLANTYLLPQKTINQASLESAYASSTDQKTLDPGYSSNLTRQTLYYSLTPCSWQPNCRP